MVHVSVDYGGDAIVVHYELTWTKCVSCVNDGMKGSGYVNDEPVQ